MQPTDYRKIIEDAKKELEQQMILQEDTEQKIARLKQAIVALTPLAEEPDYTLAVDSPAHYLVEEWLELPGGITDACREIFKASSLGGLTPVEIKQKLLSMGVNLRGHKNVMASIHSTLKRLAKNEEIITKDNGLTYEWKRFHTALPPPPRASRITANSPVYVSGMRANEKPSDPIEQTLSDVMKKNK
ncbi:MAG: hypothetical protein WA405_12050 [Candidatus Acidiferrales bacterium]